MTQDDSQTPDSWSIRGASAWGWFALGLLICGFGVWATRAVLASAIIASGVIEPGEGALAMQHPEGGIVAELLVADGQQVAAGEVILRLESSDVAATRDLIVHQLAELDARRARLEAERDHREDMPPEQPQSEARLAALMSAERALFRARQDALSTAIAQLRQQSRRIERQIGGLDQQRRAILEQRRLLAAEIATQRGLVAQGLVPAARLFVLSTEQAALAGALGDNAARIAAAEERMTEIDLAILRQQTERHEAALAELRDIGEIEEELTARLGAVSRQLVRMTLRAPIAGTVHDLRVAGPYAVVRPADPLLFLVPQDAAPFVLANLAASDVTHVTVGQQVTLRLRTLDEAGQQPLDGRVETISADTFNDPGSGASHYRIRIALDAESLAQTPRDTFRSGLPVEVFIRTRDQSPAAYLLDPLAGYFRRALREG